MLNQPYHTHTVKSNASSPWSFKRFSAYHLVLLVQFLVMLPHITHLPWWLTSYGALVISSQFEPVKRKTPFKKRHWRIFQLLGFVLGVVGLGLTYRSVFGLDVGVSFLLLCLISKLLELFTRRDGYVVLSLSLFVLAGAFLMDQGLGTTFMVMLGVTAIFYVMIAHNDSVYEEIQLTQKLDVTTTANVVFKERVRSLGIVSLMAIPLMVVLFIFFPRLPPLWHINLSGAGAKTGMSDSMSPGDFSSLSKSTELAFRVLFKTDNMPPKSELYWRGMVFSQFDGTTWRPSNLANSYAKVSSGSDAFWLSKAVFIPQKNKPTQPIQDYKQASTLHYQVIMQPTNQKWLFGLAMPFSSTKDIGLTREYNLERREPISQRFSYKVMQLPQAIMDTELSDTMRKDVLQLPKVGNLQAREFAKQLYTNVGNNPERYVQAILNWIRKENFSYTLSPPVLGENRIDSFLFDTKQGFCEHYASAFTFLMRTVGIPARVVVGYQGGERGTDGKSWEVRQMDAHAWTEIWIQGKGWRRVDPTAAIAPERVNNGMNHLTQVQGAELFGEGAAAQLSYQQFKLMQRMRKAMDYMGYVWQRDVVGFDTDKQKNSLFEWFNLKNQYQQILVMFVMVIGFLAIFVGMQFWRRRKIWHPLDAPLIKLSKQLAKNSSVANLARFEHEGMLAWLNRVGNETEQTELTKDIAHTYRKLRYSDTTIDNKHALNLLKEKISKLTVS